MTTDHAKPKQPIQKACCGRCGYFMALKDSKEISVRVKDLYFYFYGGLLTLICRGCGAPNYIVDVDYEVSHPEIVQRVGARSNMIKARFEDWMSRKKMEEIKTIKGDKSHVLQQA